MDQQNELFLNKEAQIITRGFNDKTNDSETYVIIAKTVTFQRYPSHDEHIPLRIKKQFMVVVEYKEVAAHGELYRHQVRTDPYWEQKLWVTPIGTFKHDDHGDQKFLLLHVSSEKLFSEDDMYKTLKHHTFKFTENNNVTQTAVILINHFTCDVKENGDWATKCSLKRKKEEIDTCLHKLGFKDWAD
jgi:hypothetical protein